MRKYLTVHLFLFAICGFMIVQMTPYLVDSYNDFHMIDLFLWGMVFVVKGALFLGIANYIKEVRNA